MRTMITTFLGSLLLAGAELNGLVSAADQPAKLPLTGQPPAKLIPNLCLLHYRVSTDEPKCQAYFDQGLAYYYSYVYGEAAQSFETATFHDPECALAWWGLSRALDRQNKPDLALKALQKARAQQERASHPEQFLITALWQYKGPAPSHSTPEAQKQAAESRRLAAIRTIDELLSLYDNDEEGWFFRAQLAGGGMSAVPFYKTLLLINPLHPGGNHDLIHYYSDSANRPALAWTYSENYIKGSPGMQHAYHMQVNHVAVRLGRWDKVIERAGRGEPGMLMLALIHDGRLNEARKLPDRTPVNRFYLHAAERNWNDARQLLEALRDGDKPTHGYLTALFHLKQDRPELAAPSIEALRELRKNVPEKDPKGDRGRLDRYLGETQGLLLCQQGDPQGGLALLGKLVQQTMGTTTSAHWGHGAYYMECWGIAALKSGQDKVAELAFLEALTHESGSARGALGMQILCERQGRDEEAQRFGERARRIWQRADPGVLDAELAYLRKSYPAKESSGAEK